MATLIYGRELNDREGSCVFSVHHGEEELGTIELRVWDCGRQYAYRTFRPIERYIPVSGPNEILTVGANEYNYLGYTYNPATGKNQPTLRRV